MMHESPPRMQLPSDARQKKTATFNNDVEESAVATRVEEEKDNLTAYQAQFFKSDAMRQVVRTARNNYPHRNSERAPKKDGDEGSKKVQRRIMGFGLGFEKIFATTSIKLPVTAYTIYAEMHLAHKKEVFSRVFNGLNTIFDLKKWVYEKLWVPITAYELSYAEPGKATLTDNLRLLTTDDSIDSRTFATTRAAHGTNAAGTPGVHSIGDIGVTRLYVRLKCRKCGDLVTDLQTCRKFTRFGDKEAVALDDFSDDHGGNQSVAGHLEAALQEARSASLATGSMSGGSMSMKSMKSEGYERMSQTVPKSEQGERNSLAKLKRLSQKERGETSPDISPRSGREVTLLGNKASRHGRPGTDPNIEDIWYRPDENKHCLFHTRGFEMFEAARTHGGHAELARIYISCDTEPSKKLRLREQVLSKEGGHMNISY